MTGSQGLAPPSPAALRRLWTRRAATFGALAVSASGIAAAEESGMERVLGVGGFFFRARDPEALARWYADNLGVAPAPQSYDAEPWRTEAGVTIFAPFDETSARFGDSAKQWMMNFRVRNLDAIAAQLRRAGVGVEIDPQPYPNGRFARLHDPEGNPIELWEAAHVAG